eukprot:Hpha_TRINITY_DN16386_c3_g10::TRINITY_DN16386_c3_g10_i2::g.62664::m.62664
MSSPPARYFCALGEEESVVNVTDKGVQRSLFTYFHTDRLAGGFEWVEIGSEVPWHSHAGSEELIFCTHGEGVAYVGDEHRAMRPGVMVMLPRGVRHRFVNSSATERLGFTWTLVPPVKAREFMPGQGKSKM